jgi:uncharacterized membrane protein YfcA
MTPARAGIVTAGAITTYLPLLAILVTCGLLGGFAAGLLGVGGGIITVPVLEYALRFADVDAEYRMHMAVATSLAAIIPTSISSARLHHARGAIDWPLARRWALPMLVAAFIGSVLASRAPLALLAAIFGVMALAVAVKMLLPLDEVRVADGAPSGPAGAATSAVIGGVSAVMGIGAGTLAVPMLNLCGYSIHRAVGTAAFFGLLISIPGTVGYLIAQPTTNLPWVTVGFVSMVGFAIIGPGAMITATWGARVAHALSRRRLSIAFGVFLLCGGARMLYRALS